MTDIRNIYDVIGEMKRKPRTGWVDHEIPNPETVWQHSRSMRVVCRELATRYLGRQHATNCAKLGAVHDIIEGVVPDITPHMGISPAEKKELEMMAIDHIGSFSDGGQRIRNLWLEFEDGASDNAAFVRKVDKLHVAFVALTYEQANVCRYSLQPFWDYAFAKIQDSPLVETWEMLNNQRPPNAADKPLLERRPKSPGTYAQMKQIVAARIGLGS